MTFAEPRDAAAPPLPRIEAGALAAALARLGPGQCLVLVDAERRAVVDALRGSSPRSALALPAADARGAPGLIQALLDDLAALALDRWPDWPAAEDPWTRAAARLAGGGRAPRLRRAGPEAEFGGLRRLVDPGLVLLAEVDPAAPRRARATIDALEWAQGRGAPAVALLRCRPAPEPPYDRLLYGARALGAAAEPAAERFVAPAGQPHHASATERRVKAALDADAELAPLFACNQCVALRGGAAPRVDLLWRDGRVVVELDGPEHQASPKFADDRHRDYELMVAGYRVLRITNGQVETDLQRAIEKIRDVVRLGPKGRTTG